MPDTMSDTMAEAFCEEYLITWMETRRGRTPAGRMGTSTPTCAGSPRPAASRCSRQRAITPFQAMQKNGYYMTVTVFRDRSWMVHEEPTSGEMVMVGTREDEHRILDSHPRRAEHLAGRPGPGVRGGRLGRLGPGQTHEPARTRAETRAAGIPRASGHPPRAMTTQLTRVQEKPLVALDVAIMNYRLFLMEPKRVYPQLAAKRERSPSGWWLSGNRTCRRRRNAVRARTALHAERRTRRHRDVRQEIPGGAGEEGEAMSSQQDGNTVITVEVTANHIYGCNPDNSATD